jgi:hypothetical protein
MKIIESRIRFVYGLAAWLFLLITPVCFGAEYNILRTQGLINPGGNLKGGYLLINEMRIYIDRETQVMDDRGTPLPATELKPRRWVFMEIEKDSVKTTAKAKKIYLLPHYIKPGEKQRFSFMK